MSKLDRRTKAGREATAKAEQAKRLEPVMYFVKDDYAGNYRIGRFDWPGDCFNIISTAEFETFRKVYEGLNFKLKDMTYEDDDA